MFAAYDEYFRVSLSSHLNEQECFIVMKVILIIALCDKYLIVLF